MAQFPCQSHIRTSKRWPADEPRVNAITSFTRFSSVYTVSVKVNENGIPVFHPSMGAIALGATIGAGLSPYYARGDNLGVMLANYLDGDLDVASTAISIDSGNLLGVNLDSAGAQDVDISDELMGQADLVMRGGRVSQASPDVRQAIVRRGKVLPLEDRLEGDLALVALLQWSVDMIAEQQAELDAASE